MNKKIEICMNYFKSIKIQPQNSKVNERMLEEQVHRLTINMDKVENDCSRNRMVIDAKIDELFKHFNRLRESRSRSVRVT